MSPRLQIIAIGVVSFVAGIGLGQCGRSSKPTAPAADSTRDLELEVARGAGAACAERLRSTTATAEALQARMDAIAPARASLKSSHPSLLVKKGLLVADVDAVLGMARETQMTTCGSKSSGDQWPCLVRTYCTIRGCVMVLFRRNGGSGDWVVDTWHKAIQ
jgi:hypothetical protein